MKCKLCSAYRDLPLNRYPTVFLLKFWLDSKWERLLLSSCLWQYVMQLLRLSLMMLIESSFEGIVLAEWPCMIDVVFLSHSLAALSVLRRDWMHREESGCMLEREG